VCCYKVLPAVVIVVVVQMMDMNVFKEDWLIAERTGVRTEAVRGEEYLSMNMLPAHPISLL